MPAPARIKVSVAGSGTAVMFNPQLTSVPSPPDETSETNKVQVPLGSIPLNERSMLDRAAELNREPADRGSIARPSDCHVPVNWLLPFSV